MNRTLVKIARIAVLGAAILFAVAPARATEVRIFQVQTGADFRAGTLSGIALDPGGFLDLAPRVERVAGLAEPFVFSVVAIPDGWAVGTGNDGKVLKVTAKGEVSVLFDAPEPEVFALWADADATLFAGTSPNGKVYRIATSARGKSGSPEAKPFFDPGATYIWAIRRAADGALLVATGTEGKLFRVDGEGKGKVLYDADEPHLRSLLPLPASAGGDVVVGTSGEGLVVRIAKDGSARTLFDAEEPEVAALALGPDGTIYAALVASEASLVPESGRAPAAGGGAAGASGPGGAKPGEPTVTVSIGDPEPAGRKDGAPRSEVVAIAPNGLAEGIGSFADETVFDLLWQERLWVATGLEGKLYSFRSSGAAAGRMELEKDTDERQLVALVAGAAGPTIATTNGSALYRTTAELERQGTFTGAVLDAGAPAKFGRLRWRGEVPDGSSVSFSVRSGASANPDRTWSDWSPWRAVASRDEIAISGADGVPDGRYLQWRAQLAGSSSGEVRSPRIAAVELSYRQLNQRPKIEAFGALPPGQILVPQNFNPSNQVFEPVHPNREGVFTTLAPADEIDDSGRLKPLWKLGYRSLRWKASDPNGDPLRYRLTFRPAGKGVGEDTGAVLGEGSDGGAGWLKLADDLAEEYLSFDVGALPDGLYRFRLEATDADANDAGEGLFAEEVSPALTVDHSPPVLASVAAEGSRLRVGIEDVWSPVRDAQVSVDGGEWQPARAADGLLDGRREELILEVPAGARYLLLRTTDGAYNAATFDLTGKIARGKGR
jgi:hypothetical protein